METRNDSVFIDLAAAVWKRRWMVIGITLAALLFAMAYSISGARRGAASPPATATWVKRIAMIRAPELRLVTPSPSMLSAGDGRIAIEDTLADPVMRVRLAKIIGQSADLIDVMNRKFSLAKRYGIPDDAIVLFREEFNKHMQYDSDAGSEIIVVSFQDADPQFADSVNEAIISYIDTRLASEIDARLKALVDRIDAMLPSAGSLRPSLEAQKNLAVLQRANPVPTLAVVDFESTTLPTSAKRTSRTLVAIAGIFSAIFFSVFLAVVLESLERARNDPETVARFRVLTAKRPKK